MAVKANYYTQLRDFCENLQNVEELLGDLQRVLLNIKSITPGSKTNEVNIALGAMSNAINQVGTARDRIANKALVIFEDVSESVKNAPKKYYIKQTEISPVERFEIRQRPTDEAVTIVSRAPTEGTWRCYQCTENKGCNHIESLKEWIYRGKPNDFNEQP